MEHTLGQRFLKRFGVYLGAFLLAAAVWRFEYYMQSGPQIYQATPIQDKAVDTFLEMNRLLTALATSLLGAMGLLLFNGLRGRACTKEMWAAVAGAVSVGASIYYGYVANLVVMTMVASGNFDPYNSMLMRTHSLHFGTFLVGVIFFAGFIYQNVMTGDDDDEHPKAAAAS